MSDVTPDPHRNEPTPAPEEGVRPEAGASVVRPEQEEPNGPVPGLLATAEAEASAEVGIADAEDEEQLAEAGVEEEGIESAQIAGIVAAIMVSVGLLVFVLVWAFYIPTRDASEVAADSQIELGLEQQTILANGLSALENYSMTADSSYTLPISVAKASVVEAYGGSAADSALAGQPAGDVPAAMTRAGFNIAPVQLNAPRAIRAASQRGAFTAPVPETADGSPVPPSVAAEPITDEEVGADNLSDAEAEEPIAND